MTELVTGERFPIESLSQRSGDPGLYRNKLERIVQHSFQRMVKYLAQDQFPENLTEKRTFHAGHRALTLGLAGNSFLIPNHAS